MAPLKISIFEPFKNVDFRRSYITFSETSKLKKLGHQVDREHTPQPRFKCEVCNIQFSKQAYLLRHMRTSYLHRDEIRQCQ